MNGFRKLKNDDKGMTLVEVIIAITILGIVVVPVLRSLTTSMAYNAKARVRQELTLTAESIMESFKGYGITRDDGMVERFADGTGLSGLMSGDALNGVSYSCEYSTDSGATYTGINSGTTDMSLIPVDAYYKFTATGLISNSQTYDVTITAKPDSTLDVYVPTDANAAKDAVYEEDEKWETTAQTKAAEDFCDSANGYATELAEYFQGLIDSKKDETNNITYECYVTDGTNEYMLNSETDITNSLLNESSSLYIGNSIVIKGRTLEFAVDYLDSDEYVVTVDISCDYCVSGYTYLIRKVGSSKTDEYNNTEVKNMNEVEDSGELTFPSSGSTCSVSGVLNEKIYEESTTAGLDRLYIYYYPYYDHNDSINISFTSNLTGKMDEFECYILKQRTSTLSSNRTATKESSYHASVNVENPTGAKVTVFHNYDYNIGSGKKMSIPAGTFDSGTTAYGLYSGVSGSNDTTEEEALSYTVDLIVTRSGTDNQVQVASLESTVIDKIQ